MDSDKPNLPKTNQHSSTNTMILSVVAFVLLFYFFISSDILLIGLLVAVLFIHELGHYLTMKYYKYENLTMLFIPFLGAVVHGKKSDSYSEKERANILLAGPIPGIILGALLLLLGLDLQNAYLIFAATLFVMINALNLIPIDPLDGGQLLYMLFFGKREDWRLYYLFGSSLLTIGVGLYFQNYIVVGFGFLMGIRVRSYQKTLYIHRALKEEGVDYEKTYEELSGREFRLIKRTILENSSMSKNFVDSDITDSPEFEEIMAKEVEGVLELPTNRDLNWAKKMFYFAVWLIALVGSAFLVFSNGEEIINMLSDLKLKDSV